MTGKRPKASAGSAGARRAALLSLVLVTPAGFLCKYPPFAAPGWIPNGLAGALYEIFWCLAALALLPRARPGRIAAAVLLATCALEFLQLWRPPLLEAVRATFLGRALIGSDFAWADFPFYLLGSAAGWGWLALIRRRAGPDPAP